MNISKPNEQDELIAKNDDKETKKVQMKESSRNLSKNKPAKKNVQSMASKKEKKITKTLAIVLIVYLCCW